VLSLETELREDDRGGPETQYTYILRREAPFTSRRCQQFTSKLYQAFFDESFSGIVSFQCDGSPVSARRRGLRGSQMNSPENVRADRKIALDKLRPDMDVTIFFPLLFRSH